LEKTELRRGSKGERLYDWCLIPRSESCKTGKARYLLLRRNIDDPKDIAYHTVYSPITATMEEIVRVAGQRWPIEECFQIGKGETGLDHYEVRTYKGWHRHITLSMLAMLILLTAQIRINKLTEYDENNTININDDGINNNRIIKTVETPLIPEKILETHQPGSMDTFKKKRKI
jgi:SRSO17 transposase